MARRRVLAAVVVLLLAALVGCTASNQPRPSAAPTVLSGPTARAAATDLVTGLDVPWGLAFLPDGRALVTLRNTAKAILVDAAGRVTDVTGPGAAQLAADVVHDGEGGLLGVAVLGSSAAGVDLALYTTTAEDNRVVRGTLAGAALGRLTPIVTGIHRADHHDGGGLAVGPDGYLYVGTGDAGARPDAQDPGSLNGKILRVTLDGDPAPGNPTAGSRVWSLGHRNVQGLGWSADGRMFASEFGQDTWDELNVIVPGGNYGWPTVEGDDGQRSGFVRPVAVWHPADASPSGLAVTGDAVYLAALRGERLWRVPLTAHGVGTPQALFVGTYGRLRTVAVAPDGSLWVLTNNTDGRGDPRRGDDRILRVIVRT